MIQKECSELYHSTIAKTRYSWQLLTINTFSTNNNYVRKFSRLVCDGNAYEIKKMSQKIFLLSFSKDIIYVWQVTVPIFEAPCFVM